MQRSLILTFALGALSQGDPGESGFAAEWISEKGCRYHELAVPASGRAHLAEMPSEQTGITFRSDISEEKGAENSIRLAGTGVAAGDVDGDGWCDLFFCSMGGKSVLYRNLGNWRFEDVTASAGLACEGQESTGAVFADVDGDGDLDLLINSIGGGTRLFLNDGKGHFSERVDSGLVRKYGSNSMALADLDGNGTLDLYVVNYASWKLEDRPTTRLQSKTVNGEVIITALNGVPTTSPDLTNRYFVDASRTVRELGEPDVVYLNDGHGKFTPIPWTDGTFSDENGKPLTLPPLDWGLSVMFRDINGDGAPDIYVCNDLFTPDRIWINDGHGHFKPIDELAIRQTSLFSMGIDFADINRDGYDDFFVADMLSASLREQKVQVVGIKNPTLTRGKFNNRLQYKRNTLSLNRGDGSYAEIGQMSGVEATGWSWCPMFLDLDLDGFEDLFITAGYYRDALNIDAVNEMKRIQGGRKLNEQEFRELKKHFPPLPQKMQALHNRRDLTFENVSADWGFNWEGISQAICAADLDNDGDLDVIVVRQNAPVAIYKNESAGPRVAVRLKGNAPNTRGVGAKIQVSGGPVPQSQEMICGGRYMAGDDNVRVFAAGAGEMEIKVVWRSGLESVVRGVHANRVYEIDESGGVARRDETKSAREPLFAEEPISKAQFLNREEGLANASAVYVFENAPVSVRDSVTSINTNISAIAAGDMDGSGHPQLFIAGGVISGRYPEAARSHVANVTPNGLSIDEKASAALTNVGLVEGAIFTDIDGDGRSELALACEWGPIRVFRKQGEKLIDLTESFGLAKFKGWWNGIAAGDFDGDGKMDLIASNWGRNTKYQAFRREPLRIYFGEVQLTGTFASVVACFDPELKNWTPRLGLSPMLKMLPNLVERFPTHGAFAKAGIDDVLAHDVRDLKILEANCLETTLFLNRGDHFDAAPLPAEAQMAPSFGVSVADFNGDGFEDVFLAQNFFGVDGETARYDAGRGLLLFGNGRGEFTAASGQESGIRVHGEQRSCAVFDYDRDGRADLMVTQDGAETKLYHNRTAKPGLRISLNGPGEGRGIGAMIRLVAGGKLGPAREIHAGSGYWSQDCSRQVMNCAEHPEQVWVRWPGGKETISELPRNAASIVIDANGKVISTDDQSSNRDR